MNVTGPNPRQKIKWGYVTHRIPVRPAEYGGVEPALLPPSGEPSANDVLVAEVLEIGRHTTIQLSCGHKSRLFDGDVVVVAYGQRYATRQWRGRVPDSMDVCHMLSVGGVCGEVVDTNPSMKVPTVLRPLGFLASEKMQRLNLRDHALGCRPLDAPLPTIVLVVGSAMDSGKTTAAYSTIHGLARSGASVAAAKLTGTAAMKDLLAMDDAGAVEVMDFTSLGFGATAGCSRDELQEIATTVVHKLAQSRPDYIVLEIADGLVQRETDLLLTELAAAGSVDHVIYTCNDSLGVESGVRLLQGRGFSVAGVSGCVACSPLAAQEAQKETEVPVLLAEQLQDASVRSLLPHVDRCATLRVSGAATTPAATKKIG